MVDYLPRSAWNARPPNGGPGNLTVSLVEGAAIHWPGTGSTSVIHTQAAVASALRGWQNYHMDVRGWSDIAYQVAVDQAGRAWTLRGLHTQSGANGSVDVNERFGAILLVLVTGEQPTAAMKATVRGVIADFRRIYPKGTAIKPHSAVRPEGTDCPGDPARAAIARGDFTPGSTTSPTPVQEDDMSAADVQAINNYTAEVSKYLSAHVDQVLAPAVDEIKTYTAACTTSVKDYVRQTDNEAQILAAVTALAKSVTDLTAKVDALPKA